MSGLSVPDQSRYTAVAIILHWMIALGILILIVMGLVMDHVALPPLRLFQLYQLHKSIGITVLLAIVLRLLWRLTHKPPALPKSMPPFERGAAEWVHGLLYGLQLILPISGWALVSASILGIPTVLYGVLPWPHLPILSALGDKAPAEATLKLLHHWSAWALLAIIVLHAGAALRHHFILHDRILQRMLPR